MLTFAAPSFEMSIGMESGGIRSFPASKYFFIEASITSKPPMPLPMTTPAFSFEIVSLSYPASAIACADATVTNWQKRAIFRASFRSIQGAVSKFFTSAAIFTLKSAVSKRVMGPTPLRPSRIPAQVSSTVFPSGVTAPSPVTTTRLFMLPYLHRHRSLER